jgi:UDP-2,3-diacylglucosamine pyrophosphatase LpxH
MLFIGDIHGKYRRLNDDIPKDHCRDQTIIQVGDFGIGFRKLTDELHDLSYLNASLAEYNNKLLVIRGNHDNPGFFNGKIKDIHFSNIEFLPDYSVRNVEGKNILFIGGAISVDRFARKEGIDYWKDEVFELDEKLSDFRDIQIVVTHTCPLFANPVGVTGDIVQYYSKHDVTLMSQLLSERIKMSAAYDLIKANNTIQQWIYGHFHNSAVLYHEGCKFVLLNCEETYVI